MFKFSNKKEKEPEDLKEVLAVLKKMDEKIKDLSAEVKGLKAANQKNLQKVSIIRFNPFHEAGGDQSFCVALLDQLNNGLIITSLYGRDANRIYSKPIINGTSSYSLSNEEKEALDKAMSA
jgi:hypothetical protein